MAAAVKRSGQARLKAALVLRDALAAELGVDLMRAMKALRNVEETLNPPHDSVISALPAIAQTVSGKFTEIPQTPSAQSSSLPIALTSSGRNSIE